MTSQKDSSIQEYSTQSDHQYQLSSVNSEQFSQTRSMIQPSSRDPTQEQPPQNDSGQSDQQYYSQGYQGQPSQTESMTQPSSKDPIQQQPPQYDTSQSGQQYPSQGHQGQFSQMESMTQSSPRDPTQQQPPQYNPGQSGQQYYSQGYPQSSPPPSYYYGSQYTRQPQLPNAKGSPMVRRREERGDREESEPDGWTGFSEKTVRAKFIRKVYIILSLQLLFTLGMIALFIYEPHVKRFVQENIFLYWVAFAIFFSVYIALVCSSTARRKFPMNIIALVIFTLSMSYMCATISTIHDTDAVLMAAGICAAVCIAVTIFSFYTKFDFTSCGGILCILMLILILFSIIAIFYPNKIMIMLYSGLGATVFTLMLAYDTQMMIGGKNHELSPEEHVFAAVQIYLDVVYIFIHILTLISASKH